MLKKTTIMLVVLGFIAVGAQAGGNGAGGPVSLQGSWIMFGFDVEALFTLKADGGPNEGTMALESTLSGEVGGLFSRSCQGSWERVAPTRYEWVCVSLLPVPPNDIPGFVCYSELEVLREADGGVMVGILECEGVFGGGGFIGTFFEGIRIEALIP